MQFLLHLQRCKPDIDAIQIRDDIKKKEKRHQPPSQLTDNRRFEIGMGVVRQEGLSLLGGAFRVVLQRSFWVAQRFGAAMSQSLWARFQPPGLKLQTLVYLPHNLRRRPVHIDRHRVFWLF